MQTLEDGTWGKLTWWLGTFNEPFAYKDSRLLGLLLSLSTLNLLHSPVQLTDYEVYFYTNLAMPARGREQQNGNRVGGIGRGSCSMGCSGRGWGKGPEEEKLREGLTVTFHCLSGYCASRVQCKRTGSNSHELQKGKFCLKATASVVMNFLSTGTSAQRALSPENCQNSVKLSPGLTLKLALLSVEGSTMRSPKDQHVFFCDSVKISQGMVKLHQIAQQTCVQVRDTQNTHVLISNHHCTE